MPTYDYLCPNGHRFEVIHSLTAAGPTTCPVCGEGPVRKVFSAPTFHFKGSGWAKKDRSSAARSASKAASASSDGESGAGSEAGTGAGSGTDKGKGLSTDGAASSDPKPASGKASPGETGKATDSSSAAGPAAAD